MGVRRIDDPHHPAAREGRGETIIRKTFRLLTSGATATRDPAEDECRAGGPSVSVLHMEGFSSERTPIEPDHEIESIK